MRSLSEAELPNARTQERAQELQARSLLNSGGVPEGNHTVTWIWRGSLKAGSGDQSGQDKLSEGLISSLQSCELLADSRYTQSFVSNGQRLMQGKPGGRRKLIFSRRRCDGSLCSWDGNLATGFERATLRPSHCSPLVLTGLMASVLMHLGKQRFLATSAATFWAFGPVSSTCGSTWPNSCTLLIPTQTPWRLMVTRLDSVHCVLVSSRSLGLLVRCSHVPPPSVTFCCVLIIHSCPTL